MLSISILRIISDTTITYWPQVVEPVAKLLRDARNDTCFAIEQTPTKTIPKIVLALPVSYDTVINYHVTVTGKGDLTCKAGELTVWIGSGMDIPIGSTGKYQSCVKMTSVNILLDNLHVCRFRCDCPSWPSDVIMFLLHKVNSRVEICQVDFM